jgi:hypothetical protein
MLSRAAVKVPDSPAVDGAEHGEEHAEDECHAADQRGVDDAAALAAQG